MSQIPDLNLHYESDREEDMDIEDINSYIDSIYGGAAVWEEPTGLAYWGYSQSQVSDVLVDLAVSDASGLFEEFCGTSKAVIENLDSFFITQQDVDDDDNVATCAICLKEMNVGDFAK
ncbi:hypothetical protein POM88_015257 [Heracleum sosnowskyi]|uniref:Uncharacterized protein n=1 Tax=Heracleum sosnowskyi TaxID=360622 RepID=A0AAD8MVY9_9APIA|nr:hypothetical protein POM88_015257 [Heracleum sosnowskyi]